MRGVVAAAVWALAAGAGAAQERLELAGGFEPDPRTVAVEATGATAASDWVRGCPGFVAEAPALEIALSDPGAPLRVYLSGEGLAGAMMAMPDGVHSCVAAGPDGLAPLAATRAAAGLHRVWPAAAQPGATVRATVLVTERELTSFDIGWALIGGAEGLARSGPPARGTVAPPEDPTATAALLLDLPTSLEGVVVAPGCAGGIDPRRPDFGVTVTPGTPALALRLRAASDTALVALDPAGGLHCDDDSYGYDPFLLIREPAPGDWRVWAGVFDASGGEARADVSRAAPEGQGQGAFDPAGAVVQGEVVVSGEARMEVTLTLPDDASALSEVAGCVGRYDAGHADLRLTLTDPGPQLRLRVRAERDTTLAVLGPDGRLSCDDDSYGVDPEVVLEAPAPGVYSVWLGVFDAVPDGTARLEIGPASAGGASGAALDPAAAPVSGVLSPSPGAGPTELTLTLRGGAPADAFGAGCTGMIAPAAPDAVVRLAAEAPALFLRALSAADATLVAVGPDGALHCDDDSVGTDPMLAILPAPAGDYAVWVGVWGAGGAPATLRAGFEPEAAAEGGGGMGENPFAGRDLSSAAEALGILMTEQGLSEVLAYERMEETGREGFVLHGVTLTDPTGQTPPLRVARIEVGAIDPAELSTEGGPTRFSVSIEGLAWRDLLTAAQAIDLSPLPALAGDPTMDLAVSLLPAADAAERRDLRLSVELPGLFGLTAGARMVWPDGWDGPDAPDEAVAESAELELRELGLLAALLERQAETEGRPAAAIAGELLAALRQAAGPVAPGGPAARVLSALEAGLAEPGRPFALRLRLSTAEPEGLGDLMERLSGPDDPRLTVEVEQRPL